MKKHQKEIIWGIIVVGALIGGYTVYRAINRKAGRWAWSTRDAGSVLRMEPKIDNTEVTNQFGYFGNIIGKAGEKASKIGRVIAVKRGKEPKGKTGYKWYKVALTESLRTRLGVSEAWVREDLVVIKRVV